MLDFSMVPYKNEMIETLKGFIKIESVKSDALPNMPYGKGIFDALMYVQSAAESMDLDCVNLLRRRMDDARFRGYRKGWAYLRPRRDR